MENPSNRPNHLDLNAKNSKIQAKREIKECDCCGGRCSTCCPHKKDTPHTREPHYPSEGNMQKCNGNTNRILGGLPISLGQVQHEQIRQTWPRAIVEKDHSCYDRDQEQCTQQKSVGHAKARFTHVANITNGEFQSQYAPLDNDHQINSASGLQVKGETIVQSITPIHVMPTPQSQELTAPNDGPCTHNPNAYPECRLSPLDYPPQTSIGDHQIINQQNYTV